jgi:hypothetical protein
VKARLFGLMGLVLIACATVRHAASVQSAKSQGAKVYFRGKGPDRDVRRFQKFLEIALDDVGLTRTDSARDADITVEMDITREDKTEHLYAPVVWIAITSNDHQEYVLKSCNMVSTSNSVFDEPIKSIEPIRLPSAWKKQNSHLAVFLNEPEAKGMKYLLPAVKQSLTEGGYQITQTRANAEAELHDIKLQKLAIPMKAVTVHHSYEIFDRQSSRFSYARGTGSDDVTYMGVEPGIKLENLPCAGTVEHFAMDSEGAWRDARTIAKNISIHLDKATHSN